MFTWSVSVMNLAKKLALRFGKNMIKQGGGVGEWTVTSTSMIGWSNQKSNLQSRNDILRAVPSMFVQLGRLHQGLVLLEWKNNCIDPILQPNSPQPSNF